MSNMTIARPRLACGLMLAVSLCMCVACVLTIGSGWRTITAVAMCVGAAVHAVAVADGRPSDVLRFWRMAHVAATVICMVEFLPNGTVPSMRDVMLPVLTLLPIIAMATIRQSIGRSAALVPISG